MWNEEAPQLIKSVYGMVIARKKELNQKAHPPIVWSSGHSMNCLEAVHEGLFYHNGSPVNDCQGPMRLHRELITALTTPGQFVMDVCCASTATIVALLEGRNVVAIDRDSRMKEIIQIRLHRSMGTEETQTDGQVVPDDESADSTEETEGDMEEEEGEGEEVEDQSETMVEEETAGSA